MLETFNCFHLRKVIHISQFWAAFVSIRCYPIQMSRSLHKSVVILMNVTHAPKILIDEQKFDLCNAFLRVELIKERPISTKKIIKISCTPRRVAQSLIKKIRSCVVFYFINSFCIILYRYSCPWLIFVTCFSYYGQQEWISSNSMIYRLLILFQCSVLFQFWFFSWHCLTIIFTHHTTNIMFTNVLFEATCRAKRDTKARDPQSGYRYLLFDITRRSWMSWTRFYKQQ